MKVSIQKVAIWGVPRSGTSWLGQIFNSAPQTMFRYQPLFSYLFKNELSLKSSKNKIQCFFNKIKETDDSFILNGMDVNSDKKFLQFKKNSYSTHLVMKHVRYLHLIDNILKNGENIKVIGIIRNPLATINSWYKAKKEFNSDWILNEEFRFATKKNLGKIEEYYGYEKWKDATIIFNLIKKKYKDKFYLINYENLLKDTVNEIENVFQFSNLKLSEQTLNFITKTKNIHHDNDYSIFKQKKKDNHWEIELPIEIIDYIKSDLKKNNLEKYLY